ncbi:MAG TPA: MFS transporter, partial [Ktedonobacterales bacterium]|nr:MFS transporter [Ktedonobacterales bacterium]
MNQLQHSEEERAARPLWRNRDFLLLWSGQSVSTLGTGVSTFALPLLVLALTHSPALAGAVTAVRQAPYLLFSLPAGALVDRWNRKTAMICCDVARWLALGSVPLVFALGHLTLAQLFLVAFAEGTAYVVFSLAQLSALPQVVAPAHLARAYSLDNANEYAGALLGPALGAFIIGLAPFIEAGTMLAYLTDSISYLASVISLRFIRVSFQQARVAASGRSLRAEIAEGLRFLWGQRLLRLMVVLTTVINFLQSPITLAV